MQEYRGFSFEVEWDPEDKIYWGIVKNIPDVVCFHGKTPEEAYQHFKITIDDYLLMLEDLER